MARDWGVTAHLVEARPDWSVPIADALALPGDLVAVVATLAALYLGSVWRRRDRRNDHLCGLRAVTTVGLVFGGLALIVLLESVIGAPRPPTAWHAVEPSPYGFPSGHTMAATVLWGAIAWRHWNAAIPIRLLAVGVVVALVGLSRLILGVHYLPDVLAAIVIGAAYVTLADRVVGDRPRFAFGGALLVAVAALLVSGFGSRATLAFTGTAVIGAGWAVCEHPAVRDRLRTLFQPRDR